MAAPKQRKKIIERTDECRRHRSFLFFSSPFTSFGGGDASLLFTMEQRH